MIIYNVTVKIALDVHDDWYRWMKEVHIPEMMATSFFIKHQMCKLLQIDEEDGFTYAIQYYCEDMNTLQNYHKKMAPVLQKKHADRYKDRYVAFRTLMEVI